MGKIAPPSGKFVLRISPEMHARFQHEANDKQLSLNRLLISKLIQEQESSIARNIEAAYPQAVVGIIQFGSTTRGEDRETSDIDLLIVIDDRYAISRELYRIWDEKLSGEIDDKFSPQFAHLPRDSGNLTSLWLEVALEGEVLWDRDRLIRRKLTAIRAKIAEGSYVRRFSHGHPYWIRHTRENDAK